MTVTTAVCATRQAALLEAIAQVQQEGGGSVWLHLSHCELHEPDQEKCTCDPYEIVVEAPKPAR